MSSYPFPLSSSSDDLIMDRNGITRTIPLPYLPRPPPPPGRPPVHPRSASTLSLRSSRSWSGLRLRPPTPRLLPPPWDRRLLLPIDTGYDRLVDLTNDPRRQPHRKGVARTLLGGLASAYNISAPFADDITYGTKAAGDRDDWQQDYALAVERAKLGNEQLGHLGTLAYHRSIADLRADQNATNAQKALDLGEEEESQGLQRQHGRSPRRRGTSSRQPRHPRPHRWWYSGYHSGPTLWAQAGEKKPPPSTP